MSFFDIIIKLLFPERSLHNRVMFDFSAISPEKYAKRLSPAHNENIHPITACLSYKDPIVRSLIWQIKTKKDGRAIACGGYILSQKLKEISVRLPIPMNFSELIIIIPIPIHRSRRRERGYNQCELLAQEMQSHCKNTTGMEIKIEIKNNILFRRQMKNGAKKQAFKNRSERIAGMNGAFFVNQIQLKKIGLLEKQHILVIDDVVTTGSTMREALMTLKKAGCKNVSGLVLAH